MIIFSEHMTWVGAAQGPLHHWFYWYLEVLFPKKTIVTVSKMILLDQLIMSPACLFMFFYMMGFFEKKSFAESTKELQDKFFEVYKVSH